MESKIKARTWLAADDFKLNEYVSEITDRLTTIGGWISSLTSSADRFPLYTKWSKFKPTQAAKSSAADAVAALPSTLADGVASATSGTIMFGLRAFLPLLVVAAVGGVIYLKVKKSI